MRWSGRIRESLVRAHRMINLREKGDMWFNTRKSKDKWGGDDSGNNKSKESESGGAVLIARVEPYWWEPTGVQHALSL